MMAKRFGRDVAGRAAAAAAGLVAIGLAAASAGGSATAGRPDPAPSREQTAEVRLEQLIERGIRQGGPFFAVEERAVIETACGYAPGSFEGFTANFRDGTFVCSNGRTVDSPEIRAVMVSAGPRIEERVRRTVGSPEFREAVSAIARNASEQAMRALRESRVAERSSLDTRRESRRWSAETQAEVRRALAEAEVARARALEGLDERIEAEIDAAMREAEAGIERSFREERRRR
jgi:hypothetical protein